MWYIRYMKKSPDVDCPVAEASALIGDMWILLIVRELLTGPKRFCELERNIISSESGHTINTRTLTLRLQKLEKSNLIERKQFPHKMPPHVEYTLTKKGTALSKVIDMVREYGKKYL
jgi:DNA-binding HxlR family transcriptional regulator